MCKVLGISRQTYYYQPKEKHSEAELEEQVEELFMENRKIYGTRKLKNQLEKRAITISRRKIGSIMKDEIYNLPIPLLNLKHQNRL